MVESEGTLAVVLDPSVARLLHPKLLAKAKDKPSSRRFRFFMYPSGAEVERDLVQYTRTGDSYVFCP